MPGLDLVKLFRSAVDGLPTPTGKSLAGVEVPGLREHRLAKDASGCPCFLIRHDNETIGGTQIRLQNLQVTFNSVCTIEKAGGQRESGLFTIIRCLSRRRELCAQFLQVMSPIAMSLGNQPPPPEIRRAISRVVELFRALMSTPRTIAQGLWGELLVIRNSTDIRAMAAAWHGDADERFDFAAGAQRLEVKTSSQRLRRHHFSLEQLVGPSGTSIIVASIFVERSGGGVSIRSLATEIRNELGEDSNAVIRFDRTMTLSLGSEYGDWIDEGFDLQLAGDSTAYFDVASIPKVANPQPQAISEVRFCSDLSHIRAMSAMELAERGGLFSIVA